MINKYFNEKAAVWDEKIAERDPAKLDAMAGNLAIEPDSTVLDVGTGTGVFVPYILRRLGKKGRLVCLDLAEEMMKRFYEKGFEGNIEYVCADIADSKLDGGVFDTVVCYSSFPHFQDKLKALCEIRRILKDGGWLFICHTSSRMAINHIHHHIPEVCDDQLPDEVGMRVLLSEAGFTEIVIHDLDDSYLAGARKPVK